MATPLCPAHPIYVHRPHIIYTYGIPPGRHTEMLKYLKEVSKTSKMIEKEEMGIKKREKQSETGRGGKGRVFKQLVSLLSLMN